MEDIVAFLMACLVEEREIAEAAAFDHFDRQPWARTSSEFVAAHIDRHGPACVLRDVATKLRIIELHTTGAYRDYQCSNADHIQDWQCERAKEPYVEHRYCELCGHDCIEVPLLAALYDDRDGYNPAWAVK